MLAWHFLPNSGRLRYGDNRSPQDGETLVAVGMPCLALCVSGMHASARIVDALRYAPGSLLCRVRLGGRMIADEVKVCAETRTILARMDVSFLYLEFAQVCAGRAAAAAAVAARAAAAAVYAADAADAAYAAAVAARAAAAAVYAADAADAAYAARAAAAAVYAAEREWQEQWWLERVAALMANDSQFTP